MGSLKQLVLVAGFALIAAPASAALAGPEAAPPTRTAPSRVQSRPVQVEPAALGTTTLDVALASFAPESAPRPAPIERADRPARPSRSRADDGRVWAALAACESANNLRAHGAGGKYHGLFQFTLQTWHELGYAGDPHNASYGTQLEAAKRLQARRGWRQWPSCSRQLGLR